MRNFVFSAVLVLGSVTTAVAQSELLTPPQALQETFVLTDEFVTLAPAEATRVGYPVWQKVNMNGNSAAVPANWCSALIAAKPWLADQFIGTSANPQERCWHSVTAVTTALNDITFPNDVLAFWRTRPDGFEYWVPAFSVDQSDFVSTANADISEATPFDSTPLVNEIKKLEERLAGVEKTIDTLRDDSVQQADTIAHNREVLGAQQTTLDALNGRVEALENRPTPSVQPPANQTEQSTLLGFGWEVWVTALTALMAAVILLWSFGWLKLGSLGRRVDEVEEVQTILIEHTFGDRYNAPAWVESMLNELKKGEFIPLDIKGAGFGAAIPKVNVVRDEDDKGWPILRLEGIVPGQNTVHAKRKHGKPYFYIAQLLKRLKHAENGGLVEGLGKPGAAEFGVVPGTERLKPRETVRIDKEKVPVASTEDSGVIARIKSVLGTSKRTEISKAPETEVSEEVSFASFERKPEDVSPVSSFDLDSLAARLHLAQSGDKLPPGMSRVVDKMERVTRKSGTKPASS